MVCSWQLWKLEPTYSNVKSNDHSSSVSHLVYPHLPQLLRLPCCARKTPGPHRGQNSDFLTKLPSSILYFDHFDAELGPSPIIPHLRHHRQIQLVQKLLPFLPLSPSGVLKYKGPQQSLLPWNRKYVPHLLWALDRILYQHSLRLSDLFDCELDPKCAHSNESDGQGNRHWKDSFGEPQVQIGFMWYRNAVWVILRRFQFLIVNLNSCNWFPNQIITSLLNTPI